MLPKISDRLAQIGDSLRGLDVRKNMGYAEAGLDKDQSHYYAPSGDRYLENVFSEIFVMNKSVIDIGCGKGSAMLTMLKFPFAQVDGVEISPKLARIAERNLRRVKAYKSKVFTEDARSLFYHEYDMFYFYNPFPAEIMQQVMSQIGYSVRKHPRQTTVIYNNPACHSVILEASFHKVKDFPNRWGTGIYVYEN